MKIVIAAIVACAIGIVVGIAVDRFFFHDRPVGDLRVDRSDPADGPYLFLELGTDVHNILQKQYVTFRVKVKNFLPHE